MTNRIIFDSKPYDLKPGETILNGLLRCGVSLPHGCKAGVCGSCVISASEDSEIPSDYRPTALLAVSNNNLVLACKCIPKGPMTLGYADTQSLALSPAPFQVPVLHTEMVSHDVRLFRLACNFHYEAGQFVNLSVNGETWRSYSIASESSAGHIEVHVKRLDSGLVSRQLCDGLRVSEQVWMQGPFGETTYSKANLDTPLLLACTGTGFAPILGILRDAIAREHQGPVHLYIAAKCWADTYLVEPIMRFREQLRDCAVRFVIQNSIDFPSQLANSVLVGDVYETLRKADIPFAACKVFLCGRTSFVTKAKMVAYLKGASLANIHTDAFG